MNSAGHLSLGTLVRRHRAALGLTQEELAEAAGISTRSLSDMERGVTRTARRHTAAALGDALGLTGDVRRQFEAAARGRPPAEPAATPDASGVPALARPLVGRDADLTAALDRLRGGASRLLTITGAGGVGKTSLALALVRAAAGDFADGAVFVPLADVRDPALVLPAVAEALHLRAATSAPLAAALAEHLHGRHMLLVLDNMEQLTEAAVAVAALVSGCPLLRVVVTSRVALRVSWEDELPLGPLALPVGSESSPAAALFLQRVAAPEWRAGPAEMATIAEICRRLDGVPLAIELAAARVRVLTPAELLTRLAAGLALLTSGPKDAPARQRTLRATLDWSHDLLDAGAVTTFRRLAVFAGGWNLEWAEQVCGDGETDVLDAVTALTEANLLHRISDEGGRARFRMHEIVRQYAVERLRAAGEEERTRRAHAACVVEFVERAAGNLTGPAQVRWLDRLDQELGDVHMALEQAVRAGEAGTGLRIAGALWRFWEVRGRIVEGRRWFDRVLALPDGTGGVVRAGALKAAGSLARLQSDSAAARAHYEEALALYTAAGDASGVASTRTNLGNIALDEGDAPTAIGLYEESLAAFRVVGDEPLVALLLNNLALALRSAGRHAESLPLLAESLALFRARGDLRGSGRVLESQARVLDGLGEHAAAEALHREALRLRRDIGDSGGLVISVEGLARSLAASGRGVDAARLLGHADRLRDRIGEPRTADAALEVGPATADALDGLGAEQFAVEHRRGAESPLSTLIEPWS